MSLAKSLPKTLKELRVHMCQTSAASNGLRQFIVKAYPEIKQANPDVKVLIREAGGVMPRVFARFEHGKESQVSLADLSAQQVEAKVQELVARG